MKKRLLMLIKSCIALIMGICALYIMSSQSYAVSEYEYDDTYHWTLSDPMPRKHSMQKGKVEPQPTCTSTGYQHWYCVCGYAYRTTLAKVDHTESSYIDDGTSGHHTVCTTCGTTINSGSHYDYNSDGSCDACGRGLVTNPTLTFNTSSVSLLIGDTATVTYTTTSPGTASVSANNNHASVSMNGNTVTVIANSVGTTIVTVSITGRS